VTPSLVKRKSGGILEIPLQHRGVICYRRSGAARIAKGVPGRREPLAW
jgi:hypothetical protein